MGLKYVLNFKHTFKYFLKQWTLNVLKLLCELKATLLVLQKQSHLCLEIQVSFAAIAAWSSVENCDHGSWDEHLILTLTESCWLQSNLSFIN